LGDKILGVMQGRLLPPVDNRIQAFPADRWSLEFSIANELDLDCIEFIFDGLNISSHPLVTKRGQTCIEVFCEEYGISIPSVCADYFMDHWLHSVSPQKLYENYCILHNLVESCSQVGVSVIVLPFVDQSRIQNDVDIYEIETHLRPILDVAKDNSISMALEVDLPPDSCKSLLKRFNVDNLGINYDIGNSASLGYNPIEELTLYGEKILDIHIKDRTLHGFTVPLGEGAAQIEYVLQTMISRGFRGPYILQAARKEIGKEKETIADYLKYLQQYF
jgi:hexulose-6-phosphate isomerase